MCALYIFCCTLSDRFGRKSIHLFGCLLTAIITYPLFIGLLHFGNAELENAISSTPADLIVDPTDCSFQLVPSELRSHLASTSSCDVLKSLLNKHSVTYHLDQGEPGSLAKLQFGNKSIESVDTRNLTVSVGGGGLSRSE